MNGYDYDMISRYVDGEMNTEERQAFELKMQVDPQLKKEVEMYRDVNDTLQMKLHPDENEIALKNTLNEMRKEFFRSKTKVISIKNIRWLAAAAVLIIVAVSLTLLAPWKKDLYKEYAFTQMPGVAERGAPDDSLLQNIRENFNKKKYAETVLAFEIVLENDPDNAFLHYYYAIALLQYGQIEKSRNEFTQLYNGNSLFKYDAAFYLALSFLKEKDKATCKEWLNKIPVDAATYLKAQELLNKL